MWQDESPKTPLLGSRAAALNSHGRCRPKVGIVGIVEIAGIVGIPSWDRIPGNNVPGP